MAQRGRKQSSRTPGMVSGGADARQGAGSKPPVGRGAPTGPGGPRPGARTSVAAARRSKGDRTQLILGGVAVVVIIVIIVVGLVLYKHNTAPQGVGYGASKSSTATVDDNGVITVSHGDPSLQLDIYEDTLCPFCGEFETQFGQQIAKAIDSGQLTVHYHMVDFLNAKSASKTYSTRGYAALLAVAKNDGAKPGVFMQYHSALFSPKHQPKESGSTDLSNKQLADLAGTVGASKAAQQAIVNGTEVDAAKTDAAAHMHSLDAIATKAGGQAGTPTVVHDGTPVEINAADWLTNLLPKGTTTAGS